MNTNGCKITLIIPRGKDMRNNKHALKTEDTLAKLSRAIDNLTEHVGQKYFPSFKLPDWELPEAILTSKFTKKFHQLFSLSNRFPQLNMFLPASVAVTISLFISYFIHWLYPLVFYYGHLMILDQIHLPFWKTTVFVIFVSLFIFATIFSASGIYWQVYEIAINKKISPIIKIVLSLSIALFVYFFIFEKKVYQLINIYSHMEILETGLKEFLINLSHSTWVLLMSLAFIYIPLILFFAFFLAKMVITAFVLTGRFLQWYFLIQITQPQQRFDKFLTTPLPLFDEGNPKTFLEIENSIIIAIKNWVDSRRKTIQNRLIPASLGVAFLGILASTSAGENMLGLISKVFSDYFSTMSSFLQAGGAASWLISFIKLLGLMAIIILLVGPLSLLLYESVILDFISEACALAESIKIIQNQESEAKPVRRTKRKKPS